MPSDPDRPQPGRTKSWDTLTGQEVKAKATRTVVVDRAAGTAPAAVVVKAVVVVRAAAAPIRDDRAVKAVNAVGLTATAIPTTVTVAIMMTP